MHIQGYSCGIEGHKCRMKGYSCTVKGYICCMKGYSCGMKGSSHDHMVSDQCTVSEAMSSLVCIAQGRRAMAIANDITFQSGAFSPMEDTVFRAATEMALEQHLPVVYLAANSGENNAMNLGENSAMD